MGQELRGVTRQLARKIPRTVLCQQPVSMEKDIKSLMKSHLPSGKTLNREPTANP